MPNPDTQCYSYACPRPVLPNGNYCKECTERITAYLTGEAKNIASELMTKAGVPTPRDH